MLIFNYIGLAIGLAFTAIFLNLAICLLRADRLERKKSAARTGSISDAVMGRARTSDDWIPDGRVRGGMIYNRRKKRLEVRGRLSRDALDRVFR